MLSIIQNSFIYKPSVETQKMSLVGFVINSESVERVIRRFVYWVVSENNGVVHFVVRQISHHPIVSKFVLMRC